MGYHFMRGNIQMTVCKKNRFLNSPLLLLVVFPLGLFANPKDTSHHAFKTMAGTQGCVIEQITSEAYDEFQHHGVSDDGQWLGVGWNRGNDAEGKPIRGSYLLNLTTGEKTHLPNPLNHNSSFSPDGQFLIGAQYTPDGKTELYEYDLKTKTATVIAAHPNWEFKPSYSPDGTSIVFNSYRTGNSEVYVYNRSDQSMQQLTHHESYDSHGEYSPDGSKILFHRHVQTKAEGVYDFDIYVHDLTTEEESKLISSPQEESYPSWGPEGKHVVFSYNKEDQPNINQLYIMHPDGSLNQLTGGSWKDSYAQWTRDGKYIYFNSDRNGVSNIYRLKMQGSTCVKAS